jgi:hypothetical protein
MERFDSLDGFVAVQTPPPHTRPASLCCPMIWGVCAQEVDPLRLKYLPRFLAHFAADGQGAAADRALRALVQRWEGESDRGDVAGTCGLEKV